MNDNNEDIVTVHKWSVGKKTSGKLLEYETQQYLCAPLPKPCRSTEVRTRTQRYEHNVIAYLHPGVGGDREPPKQNSSSFVRITKSNHLTS